MAHELEPIGGDYLGKSIVSINQFTVEDAEIAMAEADAMAVLRRDQGRAHLLDDVMVANLFYEPSTRTHMSFVSAEQHLGAGDANAQGVDYSSMAKGETLLDTIRTVERYVDVITLRHSDIGAAAAAANVASIPIINGGDGAGEHPTQALLDLYTIRHKLGRVEGLNVTAVGDLKNGRTVHSLSRLLGKFGNKINLVSPPELKMPGGILAELDDMGAEHQSTESLEEVIGDSDVLYVTRVQKERFRPQTGPFKALRAKRAYDRVKDSYIIDAETMDLAKDDMIVMHPLPRVNEIHPEVDNDPRAAYFDQVEAGLYMRMGLIALVLGRSATTPSHAGLQRLSASSKLDSWIPMTR